MSHFCCIIVTVFLTSSIHFMHVGNSSPISTYLSLIYNEITPRNRGWDWFHLNLKVPTTKSGFWFSHPRLPQKSVKKISTFEVWFVLSAVHVYLRMRIIFQISTLQSGKLTMGRKDVKCKKATKSWMACKKVK